MNDERGNEMSNTVDTREASSAPTRGRYKPSAVWTEVLPNLWQGGTSDDDKYVQLDRPYVNGSKFDSVYTMYAFANPVDWFVKEVRYSFLDAYDTNFDKELIREIVADAHKDWKKGKRVLIRCQAGLNRSGLVIALVLIREGYEPLDAIDLLRKTRSEHVLMNPIFEKFILEQAVSDWQD